MQLVPDIHLSDDWTETFLEDHVEYEKGILKIISSFNGLDNDLYIKSSSNEYFHVKKIDNYWEIKSHDIFFNPDINSDEDNAEFQHNLMLHIRDNFSDCEYLIFNRNTGYVFGGNDIIDSDGIKDPLLEEMWNKDEVVILDCSEDIDPLVLTKDGWRSLTIMSVADDIERMREKTIEDLL